MFEWRGLYFRKSYMNSPSFSQVVLEETIFIVCPRENASGCQQESRARVKLLPVPILTPPQTVLHLSHLLMSQSSPWPPPSSAPSTPPGSSSAISAAAFSFVASSVLSRQSASVLPPGYSLAGGGIKDRLMSPPGFSAVSVCIPCGLFNGSPGTR